jgi:hypothetical protein
MAETGTQTPVVELAAFEACDLNAPIAGVDQVGMPAISTAFLDLERHTLSELGSAVPVDAHGAVLGDDVREVNGTVP